MTPRQIELARHALGLPNRRGVAYRNHFVAGPGHRDFSDWNEMVSSGCATVRRAVKTIGGQDFFSLTSNGAYAALKPGERLDPEDFPSAAQFGIVRKDGK